MLVMFTNGNVNIFRSAAFACDFEVADIDFCGHWPNMGHGRRIDGAELGFAGRRLK